MWDQALKQLSEEPEASIEDAICAIVYAAPRTELKELQMLREIIMHKVRRQLVYCMLYVRS